MIMGNPAGSDPEGPSSTTPAPQDQDAPYHPLERMIAWPQQRRVGLVGEGWVMGYLAGFDS